MKFNPEKHYLGNLCKRGHEWEKSGKSLRYINPYQQGNCIICNRITSKRHENKVKNTEKRKIQKRSAQHRYYMKNKTKINKRRIECLKKNREKLTDTYIKSLIARRLRISTNKITKNMIIVERFEKENKHLLKKYKQLTYNIITLWLNKPYPFKKKYKSKSNWAEWNKHNPCRHKYEDHKKVAARLKKYRANLKEYYVKQLLTGQGFKIITPELIEMKKNHLILKRLIKQGKEQLNVTTNARN